MGFEEKVALVHSFKRHTFHDEEFVFSFRTSPMISTVLFFVFFSLAFFPPNGARAQGSKVPGEMIPHARYSAIPQLLGKCLLANAFREQYIYEVVSTILPNMRSKPFLIKEYGLAQEREAIAKAEQRQLSGILSSQDLNFNGTVSFKEIRAYLLNIRPELKEWGHADRLKKSMNKTLRFDLDNDGVLTQKEMSTLSADYLKSIKNKTSGRTQGYLSLDPNQDGKLTMGELEAVARKVFVTLDVNGDTILSSEELALFKEHPPQFRRIHSVRGCLEGW